MPGFYFLTNRRFHLFTKCYFGIKRGLTAVESAILLEQPMDKILTMILFAVIKKGAATVTKRDPLTDAEWDMIRHHPELGARILKYIVGLRDCVDAVLFHHERYDGKGYPRGLSGEEIPRDARIMAIADSYDAMISERGYKKRPLTEEEAIQELEACSGTQFDPELVEVFIKLREKSVTPDINLDNILQNGETEVKKTVKKK